jgi:hypothetical protein
MSAIDSTITRVQPDPNKEHWAIVHKLVGGLVKVVKICHTPRSFTEPELVRDMQALCGKGEYPVFIGSAECEVGWRVPSGYSPDEWAEVRR